MTPSRWQQIEKLYHEALECKSADRAALLARADPELRREVESLLAQQSGSTPLDRPAWDGASSLLGSTVAALTPGTQLGPYKIEGPLAAGGMGEVFRATDTRLGRSVAIKTSQEQFSERFNREARAISSLNHPHICTLHDVGPNYLVMELCEGETLAARLKRGKLSIQETLRYGAQIADALAAAHAKGITHRDLKPGNIMITRHGVKVLDFGLAKVLSDETLTQNGVVMGTPLYMAPEQLEGAEADARTDLFALGLVLYEMAAGCLPFPGTSLGGLLRGGSSLTIPSLSQVHQKIPTQLNTLVLKLLQRDPAARNQTASEVASELDALVKRLQTPVKRRLVRPVPGGIAAVLLLGIIAGGTVLYQRSEHRRWAREEAVPQIAKLVAEKKPLAAFLLLRQAEHYLAGDPQLAQIDQNSTRLISVNSTPSGENVAIQDYGSPGDAWYLLGTTPLQEIRIPNGYFRWRLSKAGTGEFVSAPSTTDKMQFSIPALQDGSDAMVSMSGGGFVGLIDFVGWVRYDLPAHDINRFEVTNREYQQFVDQGGYNKDEYWKEKFIKDGRELSWQESKDLFRDATGRTGPATWEEGHFPEGQADYPVAGVSWYEAAAYAVFAGKSLPAVAQWYKAAPPEWIRSGVSLSNFGGHGPVAVGTSPGVGPDGIYDMAGNVREWCLNANESGERFILGGAWGTQPYLAFDPEALPSFNRSPMNGFRLVRNKGPISASLVGPIERTARDFSKAKPVSDEVFQTYRRSVYAYDNRPLNIQKDAGVEDTPYWTKKKVTIDAGYGNERLPAYVFLPKNVHPPFQSVVFFPSARVDLMPSSGNLGDLQFVDYVIKSGRALVYPVYRGTYERRGSIQALPGTIEDLQLVVETSKEVRRSVDYLEALPDQFDGSKIAYLGVSQGGAYGVIFATLEDRFKTVIFLDGGGFSAQQCPRAIK